MDKKKKRKVKKKKVKKTKYLTRNVACASVSLPGEAYKPKKKTIKKKKTKKKTQNLDLDQIRSDRIGLGELTRSPRGARPCRCTKNIFPLFKL
jgi:hypothetical protein